MFLVKRYQMTTKIQKKKKGQLVDLGPSKNHTVIRHQQTLKPEAEKEITPCMSNEDKQKQKRMKFMDAIETIVYGKEVKEVESIAMTEDNENENDVVLNDDKTSNDEQEQGATETTEYNDNGVIENNSNSVNEE